jgi:hypothetical protein
VLVAPEPVFMIVGGWDVLPGRESTPIDKSTGEEVESSIIMTECRLLAPAPTKSMPYVSSTLTPLPPAPTRNLTESAATAEGNVTRAFEALLDGRLCKERMVCSGVEGGDGDAGGEWDGRCARGLGGECGVGGRVTRCCWRTGQ